QHNDRVMERRAGAPPPGPRLLPRLPRARVAAEHVAAHDRGADVDERLVHHSRALVHLAAREPVRLAPGRQADNPLVELLPADAEGVFQALPGAGDGPRGAPPAPPAPPAAPAAPAGASAPTRLYRRSWKTRASDHVPVSMNPMPNLVSREAISLPFFPEATVRLTKTASSLRCSPFS